MVYINDLQQLVSVWLDRLDNPAQSSDYRDALSECIYDLNNLIESMINEEFSAKEVFDSMAADDYLSTIEAHEVAA